MRYCEAIYRTKRFKTREVKIGSIGVGKNHPIRIQSMTTTPTDDVVKTVDQIMRLTDEGCEIVRVTVQGIKEAKACELIKNQLLQKGYTTPLVADIHFYPKAALFVSDFVDKVRINPGNFIDPRASFQKKTYDEAAYQKQLKKIEEVFGPLVEKCLKLKRAIRIGTNHGSLSDRIMNRYGNTPLGMVESALEFAHVCRKKGFHNFLFSMKSSHPQVMIHAYRLLVYRMLRLGWDYPLHLGVTEAGDGEEGRIKSAVGIGTLLLDGLGDTIRVSLTEDPWHEIDPCQRIIRYVERAKQEKMEPFIETKRHFQKIERRFIRKEPLFHSRGSVIIDLPHPNDFHNFSLKPDLIYIEKLHLNDDISSIEKQHIPILTKTKGIKGTFLVQDIEQLGNGADGAWVSLKNPKAWNLLLEKPVRFILLELNRSRLHEGRYFFEWFLMSKLDLPVILVGKYPMDKKDVLISASAELGALLADGLGEGVLLRTRMKPAENNALSFSLLQACRMRISKTEFIACPSCGRTLFNLQEVTRKIRLHTSHLKGLKIAVMGCIVNGPGEMADADFGYVGSSQGKVDLYLGKTRVEKNIPSSEALKHLIALIKREGRWVEPQQETSSIQEKLSQETFTSLPII